ICVFSFNYFYTISNTHFCRCISLHLYTISFPTRRSSDLGMNMGTRNEYEIVGTQGTIRVPKAFIPQEDGEGIIQFISNDGSISKEKYVENYYVAGVEYFSKCIL